VSNVFFIGDTHFCHDRIVEFRGFQTVEEHDAAMVDNWNSVVGKRDTVWHLGDIGWGSKALTYLSRCNGLKKLVLGNHDHFSIDELRAHFAGIYGVVKKYGAVLTHVPIHPQELAYRWTLNVHGHIHHADRQLVDPRYLCLNADMVGLKPVPLEVVKEKVEHIEKFVQPPVVRNGW